MDFGTVKGHLEALGLHFGNKSEYRGTPGQGREAVSLPFFTFVGPGFRAIDWYHIASHKGDSYIGGCWRRGGPV